MKKLAVLIVCAAVMASCDSFSGGSKNQLKAENDSLLMELTQRNAELDEMMGTFNDISEGFRQINAAESRVDLQRGAVAEGSLNAKQQIASDIEFIRKQMEENKERDTITKMAIALWKHTDGRETKHFLNRWFDKLLKTEPKYALAFLSGLQLKQGKSWVVERMLCSAIEKYCNNSGYLDIVSRSSSGFPATVSKKML